MGIVTGCNDKAFGALYLAALLATTCWGLGLKALSNDLIGSVDAAYLDDPAHCPAAPGPAAHAPTAAELEKAMGPTMLMLLVKEWVDYVSAQHAWRSLAACMVLGLGAALLAVELALRAYSMPRLHSFLKTSICLAVSMMALSTLIAILFTKVTTRIEPEEGGPSVAREQFGLGVTCLSITTGLLLMVIYLAKRGRLKTCARLLQLAATHVLGLDGAIPLLASVCAIGAAGGGAMLYLEFVAGLGHGKIVSNGLPQVAGHCLGPGAPEHAACCRWEPPFGAAWYRAYVVLSVGTRCWSFVLLEKIVRFVVGGGTSTLATSRMLGQGGAAQQPISLQPFVRAALGRSFGSLCLAALLLPFQLGLQIVGVLQHALARGGRMQGVSIIFGRLTHATAPYLSKFAPARMAATGDPFFAAGRDATGILSSRSLKVYHSWGLPPIVCFVNAAVSAVLLALVLTAAAASAMLGSISYKEQAAVTFIVIWDGLFFPTLLWFVYAAVMVLAGLDAMYLLYASMDEMAAPEDWANEAELPRPIWEAFQDTPVRELAFQRVRPYDDDVDDRGQRVSLVPIINPLKRDPPA